jgi:hypothetical protein
MKSNIGQKKPICRQGENQRLAGLGGEAIPAWTKPAAAAA